LNRHLKICPDSDIAFIDEIYAKGNEKLLDVAFNNIWKRRIKKSKANGVHGIIFYELEEKKIYYPSRQDEKAVNPDGSKLRAQHGKN
jgi:hypothetical protein